MRAKSAADAGAASAIDLVTVTVPIIILQAPEP